VEPRPQPQSSIELQKFGVPNARIKRCGDTAESNIADVDREALLKAALSGLYAASRAGADGRR
jgi:hypothetical protein